MEVRTVQTISFFIFLFFLTLAFVASAECKPSESKNIQNLRAISKKMNAHPQTLVPLNAEYPFVMGIKKEVDYAKNTGRLPTFENLP
jgi:ABC-type oligopeptide transport system substrate-binding subunit